MIFCFLWGFSAPLLRGRGCHILQAHAIFFRSWTCFAEYCLKFNYCLCQFGFHQFFSRMKQTDLNLFTDLIHVKENIFSTLGFKCLSLCIYLKWRKIQTEILRNSRNQLTNHCSLKLNFYSEYNFKHITGRNI